MPSITAVETVDVRFPTSRQLDGSDAMNPDPDYSAAYVTIGTDVDGMVGHGFTFTIGRGNEIQCHAIASLGAALVGADLDRTLADLGGAWELLVRDSQFRWLGPEKGIIHMAAGAILNALWDLRARRAGRPLWLLLAELDPEEVVALVDFRHIGDALSPADALAILRAAAPGRADRIATLVADGYPAYTTSSGWLGYDDEKVTRLSAEAVAAGFDQIKLKVGADLDDDVRRLGLARAAIGPDARLAVDANQTWDVDQAIAWIEALRPFDLAWVEEPTSPDDVLGHARIRRAVAPVPIATGEHIHNRVMFKQFLQADALDVVQVDATRVGGVNENMAILLLAAAFGKPVCPHAGGVGLCELVQHLAMFDFVAVSGSLDGRRIEYVDHLHEHFVDPVRVRSGRYLAPTAPGMSAELKAASIRDHCFPTGPAWRDEPGPVRG
jgi:L-fuconate dehydratase